MILEYKNNIAHINDVSLVSVAQEFGTPCYIYSYKKLQANFKRYYSYTSVQNYKICYAVKANNNLSILRALVSFGSWFDVVSLGEIKKVMKAGALASQIVFSGVGKSEKEIKEGINLGIHCFNVESLSELNLITKLASNLNKCVNISIRVNPDIDANTHPYISTGMADNKFGISANEALGIYAQNKNNHHIKLIGIDCHIGSQVTNIQPFIDAAHKILELVNKIENLGIKLQHIDFGGGLGINYKDENAPTIETYISNITDIFSNTNLQLLFEPGRSMVANTGVLLCSVLHIKQSLRKTFAIVDAAMNDMIRPALYDAWMNIIPVIQHANNKKVLYDIVGPVCETSDFIGKERLMSQLSQNDLLVVLDAGAYGFSMSSNYNIRPRAAEIMIKDKCCYVIRTREEYSDLWKHEQSVLI